MARSQGTALKPIATVQAEAQAHHDRLLAELRRLASEADALNQRYPGPEGRLVGVMATTLRGVVRTLDAADLSPAHVLVVRAESVVRDDAESDVLRFTLVPRRRGGGAAVLPFAPRPAALPARKESN